MTEISKSARHVEKMLVGVVALLATAALFTAGCSSQNTSTSADITGSAGSQPQRANYSAPPNVEPVATLPASRVSAYPASAAACRSAEASSDVTGSISSQSITGGRSLSSRARPAAAMVIHVIEPNETLYSIARNHHTTVSELARINEIDRGTMIRVGYWLIVPHA
ncbi:MAG: LysM domain-containing protein [Xanthobacteraceae bacterium]|jgi:LysM repeat protein